jgi:hypothetical protein
VDDLMAFVDERPRSGAAQAVCAAGDNNPSHRATDCPAGEIRLYTAELRITWQRIAEFRHLIRLTSICQRTSVRGRSRCVVVVRECSQGTNFALGTDALGVSALSSNDLRSWRVLA